MRDSFEGTTTSSLLSPTGARITDKTMKSHTWQTRLLSCRSLRRP